MTMVASSSHLLQQTLTCFTYGYFPSIKLYFTQSSKEVETVYSNEVINADGTRNKSVTITADPSTEPYVCVASDIPGSGDQERETSIFLYAPVTIKHEHCYHNVYKEE